MAVITNTFVAIVEQGFLQTKRMTRFEWLKQKAEAEDGGDNGELLENDALSLPQGSVQLDRSISVMSKKANSATNLLAL